MERTCSRCHQTKPLDTFVRSRRDATGYASHCRTCQADATRSWAERRRAGLVNRRQERAIRHSGARRYGIEIEFNGCTEAAILTALRSRGIDVRNEGYNHDTRSYWKLTTDGSVSSVGTGRTYGGHELVSPPLSGEEGFEEIRKVGLALADAGAKVDTSCGLHVHHEARELTIQTARNLIRNYSASRNAIDRVLAASRRRGSPKGNTYAAAYTDNEQNQIALATTINDAARITGRYRDVNLSPWAGRGTIEFRQHQGTVEATKMIAWIKLTQTMLERSLALTPDGAWAQTTVTALTSTLGQDTEYWTTRERRLNMGGMVA